MGILSDLSAFELKMDVERLVTLKRMTVGKVSPIAPCKSHCTHLLIITLDIVPLNPVGQFRL
jgi:hypothetical protein